MICAPCAAAWRTSCSALAILAWRSQLQLIWVAATVTRRGMAFSGGWGVARAYPINSKVIEFDDFGYHRKTCGDEPSTSRAACWPVACSPHLRGSICRADQIALRDPGDRTLSDARTPLARLHAAARVARRRFPRARRRTRRGPPEHSRPPAVAGPVRCVQPGRPRRPACPAARPADPCPGAAVVRRWRWHRACPGYGPAHE